MKVLKAFTFALSALRNFISPNFMCKSGNSIAFGSINGYSTIF